MINLIKMLLTYFVLAMVVSSCGDNVPYVAAPSQNCVVHQDPAGATLVCPNGTTAVITNGVDGAQGIAGANGQDATPVVPVQLCPNAVAVYPSVFPEVAFCIDGHLYGTYNGNTSYQYLAILPDGAYSSLGQGAACSFAIHGCSLTY